tara:strand:- start:191 stop:709 length:519 start_codon:yes stop_codon:yes gene_type:complete
MATLHHNISGELTKQLLAPGDNINLSKISLTNTQKVSSCKVDLYIEKKLTGKFYLLKGVELPLGTTLIYDDIKFNNSADQFGLYIKLTDGPTFNLTGTIDVTGTNVNVPGTNTLFLSELSVGDEVVISGETRTVATITSNTAATVTAAFGSDLANDTTPDCNPTALVDVIIN